MKGYVYLAMIFLRAKIFQVMKCSLCKRGLSLPAVHFLCQHSFHQGCLDDEFEHECSICARNNRYGVISDQVSSQTSSYSPSSSLTLTLGKCWMLFNARRKLQISMSSSTRRQVIFPFKDFLGGKVG